MIAAANGWLDHDQVMMEAPLAFAPEPTAS